MIKATCTWGDGPDVLIEVDDRKEVKQACMLLEPASDFDRAKHGITRFCSMCLTKEEARLLAGQLAAAARQAEELEAMAAQGPEEDDPYYEWPEPT